MKCSGCQSELQSNFRFCPYCGQEVNQVTSCYSCNNEVKPEWVSCPFCGSSLKGQGQAKPQDFLRDVLNPKHHQHRHGKGHYSNYEHGHHYGSSSSRKKHKKGFLGRIFS